MSNISWSDGPPIGTTNGSFREWGQRISEAFDACGCTLDSTNIDWGTVLAPDTTSQERGWEIWRFDGALHATAPVYIRLGYGSANGSAGQVRCTVQVGTTSPGGGAVGGVTSVTPIAIITNVSSSSAGTVGSWAAGDGDGIVLALYVDSLEGVANTNRRVFVIDRHRDADGVALDTGVAIYLATGPDAAVHQQHLDFTAGVADAVRSGRAPCITDGLIETAATYVNGLGQASVWPWRGVTNNKHSLSKMICTYAQFDIPFAAIQDVEWLPLGTVRTIRATGGFLSSSHADWLASPGARIATWWADTP